MYNRQVHQFLKMYKIMPIANLTSIIDYAERENDCRGM